MDGLPMTNVKKLQEEELEQLEKNKVVTYKEEVNLEDLIVLGDDKLIDILIEYPNDLGEVVQAKAKIKQLTMKDLKNLNLDNVTLETSVGILMKSLFTQDEKPFQKELILSLPIGVVRAITMEILKLSGVSDTEGF